MRRAPFLRGSHGRGSRGCFCEICRSAAESEITDEFLVFLVALTLDIIKEFAALRNQLEETAARGEILFVRVEVLGEIEDPLGKKSYLIRGASGVSFMELIRLEVDGFLFCFNAHFDKG